MWPNWIRTSCLNLIGTPRNHFSLSLSLLPADAAVDSLFKYTVSGDKAAMVILDTHGKSQSLASKGRIKDYMKRNIDRWVELASLSGPGAGKKEDDMVFISGVTTSSEWMVVALQGCGQEDKEILLSGDMNSLSSGGVRVNLSDAAATTVHCRFGPTSQGAHEGVIDDPQHLGAKQCLFVHYYKMRRRLWSLTAIEAAAGPDVLPPGEDSQGPNAQSTSAPCPQDVIDASSEAGVSVDPSRRISVTDEVNSPSTLWAIFSTTYSRYDIPLHSMSSSRADSDTAAPFRCHGGIGFRLGPPSLLSCNMFWSQEIVSASHARISRTGSFRTILRPHWRRLCLRLGSTKMGVCSFLLMQHSHRLT